MSTHVKVELIDVSAIDTEDWGYQTDEFFVKGKVRTTEPGSSTVLFETDPIYIWSGETKNFGVVDRLVFNDLVPKDSTLSIQMRAIEEKDSFMIQGLGSWSYGPEAGQVIGALGTKRQCGGCTDPNSPGGSLIMRRGNGDYQYIGNLGYVFLNEGERVRFLMNDSPGTFGNNRGWLDLVITDEI